MDTPGPSIPKRTRREQGAGVVDRAPAVPVNGGPARTVAFNSTGAWTTRRTVTTTATATATLAAGTDTIRATTTTDGGGPNSDYREVAPGWLGGDRMGNH